ncbi:DUF2332 domain-containing protein [Actinophytocola oryzae]|uniref:DUF2332 domain-containing protein n=1 Tax=Actinophytocola oryzae TaxID=502181 RepID=A0A4R7UT26_9PSEU|nr:DUF2332 domain-containing protein [Actinophytocola oryzae]TDV37616.1 hypothetical protein CLV71_12979 [Actinophytocola oryzae]
MSAALDDVRERLRRFAEDVEQTSPLYSYLAGNAATDEDVARLLAVAKDPDPELLLASVQRVLQAEPFHELTNYYPTLGGSYGPDAGLWPMFRTFALDRADRVRAHVATRRVPHGNEVGRAALFYPAVAFATRLAGGGPVGLLEVGSCAALLLGIDLYSYRYQSEQAGQVAAGPGRAALGLHCALKLAPGQKGPTIPKRVQVAARVGLDHDPVDLADEDEYAWLEACVWPDQPDRLRQLGAAATVRAKKPVVLVKGDPVSDLASAAERIPSELPVVVLTSDALRRRSAERVTAFRGALAELAASRPTYWIGLEAYGAGLLADHPDLDAGQAVLSSTRWVNGVEQTTLLAQTSWHGERMHWLA